MRFVREGKCFYICNNCKTCVKTRYQHCTICNDFDLCVNCKNELNHQHLMEKVGFDLPNESSNIRQKKILNIFEVLAHSFQCTDTVCVLPCLKMTNILKQNFMKKRKKNIGDNRSMSQRQKQIVNAVYKMLMLCYRHSKCCQETNCKLQLCSIFKSRTEQIKRSCRKKLVEE